LVNMFSNNKKKDENTTDENEKQMLKTEISTTQAPNQPATILQKLKLEEAQLNEEKQNLALLKDQLQKKIKEQIENSKGTLQKLRTEVSALKAECAELNETLQNEILVQ
jgi:hypothetical protein